MRSASWRNLPQQLSRHIFKVEFDVYCSGIIQDFTLFPVKLTIKLVRLVFARSQATCYPKLRS